MSNEFDIDDILSEIKDRKSREKGRERPTSPMPPLRRENTTEKSLYRTTFDELDELVDSVAKEQAQPPRRSQGGGMPPKEEVIAPPAKASERAAGRTTLPSPTAPSSARQSSQERPAEPKAAKDETLRFGQAEPDFMADFFQFEEQEEPEAPSFTMGEFREPTPPTRSQRPVEPKSATSNAFDFEAFDEVAPLGQGRKTRRSSQPTPPTANKREDGQPLDFGGHARPLTDKAKMRGSYADLAKKQPGQPAQPARPPSRRLQFQGEEDSSPNMVDFTSMVEASVAEAEQQRVAVPPQGQATSRTPEGHVASRSGRFASPSDATGKSLKIEDIKRIDFKAVGGAGTRDTDVYYEDYPEEDFEEGTFLNLREYRPNTDRADVSRDIAQSKVWIFVRTAATALLTFFLFFFTLAGNSKFWWLPLPKNLFPYPETMKNFLTACTVLITLVFLVNIKAIAISLYNMVRMRANSQTLSSLAVIAAVIQGIYALQHPEQVDPNKMNLYFAIAALTMLFSGISRLSMLSRIQSNFKIVSSKLQKKGVMPVDNSGFVHDIVLEDTSVKPTVTYGAKGDFFTDFLSLSFSDRYDVGINRSVAPVCLLGAVIIAFGTRLLAGDMFSALSAFTATLAISATLSVGFIESIPLGKLAKRLTPYGCMVSGNKAVEDFCDTHSVILNDMDLFPEGNITLYGIKAFPGGRLDEAILDAASVLSHVEGALSHLFVDMIGGDKRLLRKVDDIVYENGMGISAWIDKRRVLIGNRMLMQNHGVLLPNDTYERENPGAPPGNPVYISNSGEVSARFLVNYNMDEELAYQLDQLGMQNRHLVVYTTDANINEQVIWEIYGYPLELITILSADLHAEYREMASSKEELPAEIVYTGGAGNYIAAILGTVSARASILSATLIQLIQIVLGYGIVAFMAFMGYIGNLSIVQILFYQVFWFAAIIVIQNTRKT